MLYVQQQENITGGRQGDEKVNTLLRVLIVDDSEDDAKLMIRQLHKGGYNPKWERVETAEAM